VLVLLIIFMVMAPNMQKGPGPEINLPATEKPTQQGTGDRILVTLDEKGVLWIEDKQIAADRFGDDLRAAAGSESHPKVVLQCDARLPFGEIRQTMLAIEQAGFDGVALVAERAGTQHPRRG
jgi:biopolymer transport protein TolR